MLTLKNVQHKSCELSFIWGKLGTAVQETAFQIALRSCSKESRGGARIYELQQRAGSPEGVHLDRLIRSPSPTPL